MRTVKIACAPLATGDVRLTNSCATVERVGIGAVTIDVGRSVGPIVIGGLFAAVAIARVGVCVGLAIIPKVDSGVAVLSLSKVPMLACLDGLTNIDIARQPTQPRHTTAIETTAPRVSH